MDNVKESGESMNKLEVLGYIFISIILWLTPGIIALFFMNKKRLALSVQILWLLLILSTSYIGLIICLLYYNDRS